MDSDLFSRYFSQPLRLKVPRVRIGGSLNPVATLYLEDALELTGHVVRPAAPWCLHSEAAKRRAARDEVEWADRFTPRTELKRRHPNASASVLSALGALDSSIVNSELIVQLVRRYVSEQEGGLWGRTATGVLTAGVASKLHGGAAASAAVEGVVLVFLPGVGEIDEVQQALVGALTTATSRVQREWVLPLHGGLPTSEQSRVFEPAPRGITKVVLATNVAESSVTIDGVALVIDSGRVKQKFFDPTRRLTSLDAVPVSDAQAKQRRGRAGRVREGCCIHLFSSAEPLDAQTPPEVGKSMWRDGRLVPRSSVGASLLPARSYFLGAHVRHPLEVVQVRASGRCAL